MIFNCLSCGVSISSRKENCTHCRASNIEAIEFLTGKTIKQERPNFKEKIKGSILGLVYR